MSEPVCHDFAEIRRRWQEIAEAEKAHLVPAERARGSEAVVVAPEAAKAAGGLKTGNAGYAAGAGYS